MIDAYERRPYLNRPDCGRARILARLIHGVALQRDLGEAMWGEAEWPDDWPNCIRVAVCDVRKEIAAAGREIVTHTAYELTDGH